MLFNSIAFLTFFLVFYLLYWNTERIAGVQPRNILLILGSYFFYAWWDWRFLGLIVLSSVVDYVVALQIAKALRGNKRKWLLAISLLVNLGTLGFFKYYNFFIDGLVELFELLAIQPNFYSLQIILPVGISFYTFQTLSYTIDVYRGNLKPTKNPIQFFAFVAFFPQLVAGPIERAKRFLPQFAQKKRFDYDQAVSGIRLIVWGLFKKMVIADNLALIVDEVYGAPDQFAGYTILIASTLFAFQIYCDFSAYSDIAIGLGKMMGFELMTNFRKPYLSSSFGEFWQRWHISLSSWFRDYVYIPLGGNRKGRGRRDLNLMVTFLISGLWHGANITFVIWGFLHGSALVIEKRLTRNGLQLQPLVFLICALFWMPFRSPDLEHLSILFQQLFRWNGAYNIPQVLFDHPHKFTAIGIALLLFGLTELLMRDRNFDNFLKGFQNKWVRLGWYYLLLIGIFLLTNLDTKPSFIYFQF